MWLCGVSLNSRVACPDFISGAPTGARHRRSHWFSVWRPPSAFPAQMMTENPATGNDPVSAAPAATH